MRQPCSQSCPAGREVTWEGEGAGGVGNAPRIALRTPHAHEHTAVRACAVPARRAAGAAALQACRTQRGGGGHPAAPHLVSLEVGKSAGGHHRVGGQEGRQVGLHADGAHAGAAAAVGDAERLVQVQVAHVGADDAGGGEPHLRVHVGSVHVHLRWGSWMKDRGGACIVCVLGHGMYTSSNLMAWATCCWDASRQGACRPIVYCMPATSLCAHLAAAVVDGLADLVHALLVHAVGGGVRDHQRSQLVPARDRMRGTRGRIGDGAAASSKTCRTRCAADGLNALRAPS